jgi:dTDP-4-amino-4,6-dideoxygalactose transaminase
MTSNMVGTEPLQQIPIMKPSLGVAEEQAARDAIASGWVAQGPRVAAFESALADRLGAGDGVVVSSCTAALHMSLVVLDLGPSDEVIVPSLSFIATANAARYVGATPVFADVDPTTQNLTPQTIADVVTPATRAVIVVHQTGVPADMDAIHAYCDPRGISVVEDAACAIGSTYKGRPIGGHSGLVAFSFHPRKVLTTGEGGAVMTSSTEWATRLRRLREHGMSMSAAMRHSSTDVVVESYMETGFNYRMTDIQAAVGLVQLERLDDIVTRRRALAERYRQLLSGISGLSTISDPPYGTGNFQSFWVVLPDDAAVDRDEVMRRMLAQGVSTRRGIMAAHLEPAYAAGSGIELPVTDHLTKRSMILPLYHSMTPDEQDRVVAALRDALGERV